MPRYGELKNCAAMLVRSVGDCGEVWKRRGLFIGCDAAVTVAAGRSLAGLRIILLGI